MAVNLKEENFQSQVVERSLEVPIVLDFWASWCGPCRVLGPVLEKLEKDYNGGFELVKVDTEANQRLAAMFQIQSIPDVRIIKDGKLVDHFMGALPEKEIRKILDKHIQIPKGSGAGPDPNSDTPEAMAEFRPLDLVNLLSTLPWREQPENRDALLWKAYQNHTKNGGLVADLIKIVSCIEEENASFENQRRVTLAFLSEEPRSTEILLGLLSPKKAEILDQYLEKISSSQGEEKNKIKNHLIACFYFLPPDDELVIETRKKLSRLLY